jgi:anti-sigma factor RsiW
MKHLDESQILAARDGEALPPPAREHLEVCATCAAALTHAHARADIVARTLSALDGAVETTAAKAGVRARLGSTRRRHWAWGSSHLGRAAALLLVTAGAAAALPWSPVRTLWRPSDPERGPEAASTTATEVVSPSVGSSETGIAVPVSDGFVQVVVRGADPGTVLEVTWSDQDVARLAAPAGSRFTYAAGRVEVDASRGRLGVELPRGAAHVSLEVDGRLYLRGSPASPEVLGPAVERTADGIRFSVEAP